MKIGIAFEKYFCKMRTTSNEVPLLSGNSSVGRAQPCQGWGREFESRFPLQFLFRNYRKSKQIKIKTIRDPKGPATTWLPVEPRFPLQFLFRNYRISKQRKIKAIRDPKGTATTCMFLSDCQLRCLLKCRFGCWFRQ